MLSPQNVFQSMAELAPGAKRWVIAYSGGVDSHVLLHLLASAHSAGPLARPELFALHINHALHADSIRWQNHSAQVCAALGLTFRAMRLDVDIPRRTGLEKAARVARYAAFAQELKVGDVLVLAHNRDDQVETVLLRLLRGAGPAGLAGMPASRRLGVGRLVRPLLEFSRREIVEYAQRNGLHWLEDPSNADPAHDRNFLRELVIPQLRTRWPKLAHSILGSASSCADTHRLCAAVAAEDMSGRAHIDRFRHYVLDLRDLDSHGKERLCNLIRHWLRITVKAIPTRKQLDVLYHELVRAAPDANPVLALDEIQIRRYAGCLYLCSTRASRQPNPEPMEINGPGRFEIAGAGTVAVEAKRGQGFLINDSVSIGFRTPGVRCRLAGESVHRSLKRQLQNLNVPPWIRSRVPVVRARGELVAIADLAVCEGFAAARDQTGWALHWQYRCGPA